MLFRDVSQDDNNDDDGTDNKDDISRPESVDNESYLDVEEAEDLLDNSGQGININKEELTKQTQDFLASMNTTGNRHELTVKGRLRHLGPGHCNWNRMGRIELLMSG